MKHCELSDHCENYKIMCDRCKKNVNMHDFFKRKETESYPHKQTCGVNWWISETSSTGGK